MAKITPFDYHDDDRNHGNYQYTLLKDIVNSFLIETINDDSILKNTRRSLIIKYAKEAIKELNKSAFKEVLAMEITVPDSLYFALPHDYVDYVRTSLVVKDEATDSLRLKVLDVNTDMNIADGYLQDNDAAILFDEDGYILLADSSNIYNKPYKKYEFSSSDASPTLDTSKLSKYGEVRIDKRHGKIGFSSELADQEIVMEYVSDGLAYDTYDEGSIKIHKNAEQCLKDLIYFYLIQYRLNISNSEKQRALLRFKTTRHEARLSQIDLLMIDKAMNVSSKNI